MPAFSLADPPMIVLDLAGVKVKKNVLPLTAPVPMVDSIALGQNRPEKTGQRVRINIFLMDKVWEELGKRSKDLGGYGNLEVGSIGQDDLDDILKV